jgi:hypothetical protein
VIGSRYSVSGDHVRGSLEIGLHRSCHSFLYRTIWGLIGAPPPPSGGFSVDLLVPHY